MTIIMIHKKKLKKKLFITFFLSQRLALGNLQKVLRENEDVQKKVEHLEKQIREMKT